MLGLGGGLQPSLISPTSAPGQDNTKDLFKCLSQFQRKNIVTKTNMLHYTEALTTEVTNIITQIEIWIDVLQVTKSKQLISLVTQTFLIEITTYAKIFFILVTTKENRQIMSIRSQFHFLWQVYTNDYFSERW